MSSETKPWVFLLLVLILAMIQASDVRATVLDLPYGDPPDPRPPREHAPEGVANLTDRPVDKVMANLKDSLELEDYAAAQEHLTNIARRYGGACRFAWHLMPALVKDEKYGPVLWLAQKSSIQFSDVANPTHPGALKCYYLSVWKTKGFKAALAAHEHVLKVQEYSTDTEALQRRAQLGWLEAQLAQGKVELGAVRRELVDQALGFEKGLDYRNRAYWHLVCLCMARKDYDFVRRVVLRGMFQSSEHTPVAYMWATALLPLWTVDGKGPDHLIALTDEYLSDCEDEEATLRAQYFKATMYRLAAALLYRDIMRSAAAGQVDALGSDLPFMLKPPVVRRLENSFDIVIPEHEPTQNSLSQQAARHLDRLAPGSHIRNWRGAVTDEEANREVREQMLEELLKEDSGR